MRENSTSSLVSERWMERGAFSRLAYAAVFFISLGDTEYIACGDTPFSTRSEEDASPTLFNKSLNRSLATSGSYPSVSWNTTARRPDRISGALTRLDDVMSPTHVVPVCISLAIPCFIPLSRSFAETLERACTRARIQPVKDKPRFSFPFRHERSR